MERTMGRSIAIEFYIRSEHNGISDLIGDTNRCEIKFSDE